MTAARIGERLASFARITLGHFPTPLEYMENLSRELDGPQIWIKRDDCTGLASGGNKTRKLEFVLGEAIAGGADTILTTGGIQSNHARQTAAACARLGLRCILMLAPPPDWASSAYKNSGNICLDRLFGAEIHILPEGQSPEQALESLASDVARTGGIPFIVPLGASTPVGALGYVNCALELATQAKDLDLKVTRIVSAAGSGGTQAGLMAGIAALNKDIVCEGIDIDAARERTEQRTKSLLAGVMPLIGETAAALPTVTMRDDFAGPAYGATTPAAQESIRQVALSEGIVLDSAYTGKAMSALISGIQEGRYQKDEVIVFLHSGGFPLTFAYA
ncbi:D-cysteine desulfhydrase family protein [Emcibacter nanhaiensis]|uniref:D-cysteine desulfhydrase family protein n=1 Tax=Emcibacter nanhaiensis TaxID=1505037 RepID=A0A501PH15_9PROT|nr:D-cysteine desulfhydrase family protein [Emcibacter nanhaiensis]TPD59291.1 D-cysteine desulfhydrase family protein [Emcibacter nanhaiensis]